METCKLTIYDILLFFVVTLTPKIIFPSSPFPFLQSRKIICTSFIFTVTLTLKGSWLIVRLTFSYSFDLSS